MSDADAVPSIHRVIAPESIAPPAANYAHAVVTTGADRWLHTAGVVPVAPDGSVPDGMSPAGLVDQARVVWANIAAILAAASMTVDDIVSVTTYVVADRLVSDSAGVSPLAGVMAVRDEVLGGRRVASTLVTVPALAQPAWQLEIATVAAR